MATSCLIPSTAGATHLLMVEQERHSPYILIEKIEKIEKIDEIERITKEAMEKENIIKNCRTHIVGLAIGLPRIKGNRILSRGEKWWVVH